MSIVSEPCPTEHLRTVARLTAAGLSSAQIAVQLNDQGVPVPRQAVTHHSLYRHSHPYALPTDAGSPVRWNAAAVAALTACPKYDAADGYAAARAKLGSSVTTTLTMT